jgi:hypothetical protein
MNKILIACIALFAIGCSTASEPEVEVVVERTVEEINAERGDPCECVTSKIESIDAFIAELTDGKFLSSIDLNKAFAETMDGCMKPVGNKAADIAWSLSMKGCEAFEAIREAMIKVRDAAASLKSSEQEEFMEDVESGASDILEKLKEGAED